MYAIGFMIMHRLGLVVAFLYLIFFVIQEYRIIRYHCVDCYYFGKTCGFGKGRISAMFFMKGSADKFCSKEMSWKSMIPDMLITLIPVVTAIYLLIAKFDIIILIEIVFLIILTTAGNGFIRGQLTCKYCKQRELGCPAEKLFNKNNN